MWTAVLAVWELHQGNGKQGFHYGPRAERGRNRLLRREGGKTEQRKSVEIGDARPPLRGWRLSGGAWRDARLPPWVEAQWRSVERRPPPSVGGGSVEERGETPASLRGWRLSGGAWRGATSLRGWSWLGPGPEEERGQ
ncbi:unnamed protein product [Boreogadus saida]